MSSISDFYLQKTPDHAGRYLVDIWAHSDEWLEKTHDYIQWMFPNREPSPVNPKAPVLTDEIVEEFKFNHYLIEMVRTSLNRMIRFLEMDEKNPWWTTKNNHNYLRCTRILNTLKEFGMVKELDDFYARLTTIAKDNEAINSLTLSYWEDAYEGLRDYLIMVTVKAKVTATRSVDVRTSSLEKALEIATEEVEDNVKFVGNRGYQMSNEEMEIVSITAEEE